MAKTRKSGLMEKLGSAGRQAIENHKSDETVFDAGGGLPAGIETGVAQLVDATFGVVGEGKKFAGEYYFRAAGVVKLPKEHNGVPIEGLQTSIMEMMCSTPGRKREMIDDHFEWVLNQLRLLGVDTESVNGNNLEATVAALKKAMPHFRFRTWMGQPTDEYPNPRVNHVWGGVCEFSDDEEELTDDDTADPEDEDDPEGGTDEDDSEPADDDGDDDLVALGKLADDGDADEEEVDAAIDRLQELADEVGINTDKIATWVEVAAAILEKADSGPDDADAEIPPPEVGDVMKYRPARARKDVDVEITTVSTKAQTCNVKDLATRKVYTKVPWDKLTE